MRLPRGLLLAALLASLAAALLALGAGLAIDRRLRATPGYVARISGAPRRLLRRLILRARLLMPLPAIVARAVAVASPILALLWLLSGRWCSRRRCFSVACRNAIALIGSHGVTWAPLRPFRKRSCRALLFGCCLAAFVGRATRFATWLAARLTPSARATLRSAART